MKKGEVWILDSQIPHTACNLNSDNRRILSLDFHYNDEENPHWSRIFKDQSMIKEEDVKLSIVERAELNPEEIDDYLELLAEKYVDTNATEVVMKKILHLHLRFDIPVTEIYSHLIRVAELTGKKELVDFSKDMRRYFMESRVLYERFLLREDLMNSAA